MRDDDLVVGRQDLKTSPNILNFNLRNKILSKIETLLNNFIQNQNFIRQGSLIYGNILNFVKLFTKLKNIIEALQEKELNNEIGLEFVDNKLDVIQNIFDEISHMVKAGVGLIAIQAVEDKFYIILHQLLDTSFMDLKKYYAQLKRSMLSLEELNLKIEAITNRDLKREKTKDLSLKIKEYLKYAADPEVGKVVKMKYLSKSKQLVTPDNCFKEESSFFLEDKILAEIAEVNVVNKFNHLFINNCHYLLIAEQDHATAKNALKMLQQSIINANCKLNNIDGLKKYGVLIIEKMIDEIGGEFVCNNYATKVLLEDYFTSFAVIECIKYDSEFFFTSLDKLMHVLLKIYAKDSRLHKNLTEKHMEYIANAITYFNDKTFKIFLGKHAQLVRIFFKQIFTAFLKEFKENKYLNMKNLLNYLIDLHNNNELFELVKEELSTEKFSTIKEVLSVIFKDLGTYCINLTNKDDLQNCFRPWFFHLLVNHHYSEILFDKFNTNLMKLLFYVGVDDETVRIDKNNIERQEEFDGLLVKITAEFSYDEDIYNESRKVSVETCLELLRQFSGIGSLQARVFAAQYGLNAALQYGLAKQEVEQSFLEKMLEHSHVDYEKKLYTIMAQLGHLHKLKEIKSFSDPEILFKLKTANLNFSRYCDCLEKINQPFDVTKDLNQGFNVPYYLSFNFDSKDLAAEDVGLMMLILYKIFIRAKRNSEKHETTIKDLKYYFAEISKSAERLLVFYNDVILRSKQNHIEYQYIEECLNKLKQASLSAIIDGFMEEGVESLSDRVDKARLIVDNAINYKIYFIENVLTKELAANVELEIKQQTISKFFDETQEILTTMLQRNGKTLQQWTNDTSSIGEKVAFLCAKYKYSEGEFKEWLLRLNLNKENDEFFNTSLNEVEVVTKHVADNQIVFNRIDIKHLQHNQKFALSIIYQFLEKQKIENIFMQLGTGQGKSVIIAETARKILDTGGKQVFIFTCYSHLALRDYQKFKPYFQYFNIESLCCSEDVLTESKKQDLDILIKSKVIYGNLQSYFDLIRSERLKLLQGKQGLKFPDYKHAVLIMDEFDSLILDSDEIYQKVGVFHMGDVNIQDVKNKQKIKKLLGEDFINKMNQLDPELFDGWYDLELFKLNNRSYPISSESSLGITSNFVGSFLHYLVNTGIGRFLFCYLDPLVFYKEFKYIIGFSGSINNEGMKELSALFTEKKNHYYEIPPFYGIENLHQNRKFTNDPGEVVVSEEEFLNAVITEVKEKKLQGRPVLLFADLKINRRNNTTSDFWLIKERLQKEEFLDHKQFNIIKTEQDIEKIPYIGKENAVTLASRILARGADIKVDGYIKEGLHLIVTYYPPRKNIYVQMLGRTARQDDKGSYAEITREAPAYYENKVKIESKQQALHEISEYFFNKVDHQDYKNNQVKWPLFLDALFNKEKIEPEPVKNFINKHFKCKI